MKERAVPGKPVYRFSKWLSVILLVLQAAGTAASGTDDANYTIQIDPTAKFDLSPYLYMQFMEPLGSTDGSVDAAWDFLHDKWRDDVVDITKRLSPTLIRWGGIFASYYHWREGVGPRDERKPMYNLQWGGIFSNQVGTDEFVDFCRKVGAEPLIVVNFESDGRQFLARPPKGGVRAGTAQEAADWVDYCNNPNNQERIRDGRIIPYNVKMWQIGNETSYGADFDAVTAARKTREFAEAMRKADPTIQIIAWGQNGWAKPMVEIAGKDIQYVAFHQGYGPGGKESPLRGEEWRNDWSKTWKYFMEGYKQPEAELLRMRKDIQGLKIELAITEGHYFLPGRNRNEVLSTWAAGVANARIMNMYERNGDVLKIATLADFCGTRWQNNAVIIPTPSYAGRAFMMPVAMVMSLYRRHLGEKAIGVDANTGDLDITASRTGSKIFLHVANINRTTPVTTRLNIKGMKIDSGTVYAIALAPSYEVYEYHPDITNPKVHPLPGSGVWTFPAASVSAVELNVKED